MTKKTVKQIQEMIMEVERQIDNAVLNEGDWYARMRDQLRDAIMYLGNHGEILQFSSQNLVDVENLCDHWLADYGVENCSLDYQRRQIKRIKSLRKKAIAIRKGKS